MFTQIKSSFSLNESSQFKKKYGGVESHIIAIFAGGNHSWALRDVEMFERKAELDKTLSQKKHLSILKAEKENFLIADEGLLLDEDLKTLKIYLRTRA